MKITTHILSVITVLAFTLGPAGAEPLDTAFKYQGQLKVHGRPANGQYDFNFTLYDAAVAGYLLGPRDGLTFLGTNVVDGVFTIEPLNFGEEVFNGEKRWLEIKLKRSGTSDDPVILTPRQPLLAVPYASYAPKAGSASNLIGSLDAAQIIGTVSDACLPGSLAKLNANQTFTGINKLLNAGNMLAGNGAGLTGVNADRLDGQDASAFAAAGHGHDARDITSGTVADARLPGNLAKLNVNQVFTGENHLDHAANTFRGTFTGNGANLNSLNASALASGTVPGGRIANHYPLAVRFSNESNYFCGQFEGDGSLLVNVRGTLPWYEVLGTTINTSPNHGYVLESSSRVSVNLPASASVGDVVRVTGAGTGGWRVVQAAGQRIRTGTVGGMGRRWVSLSWAGNRQWNCVAASADGTRLFATAYGGQIYTSDDGGESWAARDLNRSWRSIACSADGSKAVAAEEDGYIYVSSNYGETWVRSSGYGNWWCVASSADGTKLYAGNPGDNVWRWSSSNPTWTRCAGPGVGDWDSVACSADGYYVYAVHGGDDRLYRSPDAGTTWSVNYSIPHLPRLVCSADGRKLAAIRSNDTADYNGIHTSLSLGDSWMRRLEGNLACIASSADGATLLAGENNGVIFVSTDSGVTWNGTEAPRKLWKSAAMAADGSKMIAAGLEGGYGYLYKSEAVTTSGVSHGLTGGRGTAVELQYIGNGEWLPLSHEGVITPY